MSHRSNDNYHKFKMSLRMQKHCVWYNFEENQRVQISGPFLTLEKFFFKVKLHYSPHQ